MFQALKAAKRILRSGSFLLMDAMAILAAIAALITGTAAVVAFLPGSPIRDSDLLTGIDSMLGGSGIGGTFIFASIALLSLFLVSVCSKAANLKAEWFYEADGRTISAEGLASIGR